LLAELFWLAYAHRTASREAGNHVLQARLELTVSLIGQSKPEACHRDQHSIFVSIKSQAV
jgi:hypothetical protein